METLIPCRGNSPDLIDLNTIPGGSFRISVPSKKSKTIEFFDDLYTSPPKFRVKWNTIDELHEDLFMSYNYRSLNPTFSFTNALDQFLPSEEDGTVKKTNYSLTSYLDGYLNKVTSTRFYGGQARKLQDALKPVPVYTILNGQGEIVLATSTDSNSSNNTQVQQAAYGLCGSFDPIVDSSTQLGLFFLSRADAEVYLKEIAKSDTQGTKMFGLSIHCFGLDFAYRVMREYHPTVDFRFIPDLNEVQSLITAQNTGSADLVFAEDQQQLRFRNRPLVPLFNRLTKGILPFSSFLEKTEYFKGVPIYVVKVQDKPNSFILEQWYNTVNIFDSLSGQARRLFSTTFGFGNNWILQGSLPESIPQSNIKTYIFFEQKAASRFCKQYGRQITRYSGSRIKLLDSLVKKPKIYVHNLEDFLELCEENGNTNQASSNSGIQTTFVGLNNTTFTPSKSATLDVVTYNNQPKKNSFTKVSQFFDFKYRRLSGFLEVLLNSN
jgi:hypothetical protein